MAIHVLVVDDEPDIAVIFRQKFRRRIAAGELQFSFAENGRQALQMIQDDAEISLVFTDIRMPSMDGLTFLKELRAFERQVMVPLVVSAYDDMPNIREAMRQGAWDFITKPIDLEDLERVLDESVAEVRQRQAAIENATKLADAENEKLVAVQKKQLQQEFFESITHELRTPLTLLLAPLESALGLATEAEVLGYLKQARKSGHLLLDLVNQLLDFAKINAKMLQPRLENTDVSNLVQEMASLFQPIAAQRSIQFETAIHRDLRGQTDPRMLRRILLNLLSNAFKFTPAGGKVELDLDADGEQWVVTVADSGPGISESETHRLFDRFQQGESRSNDGSAGSGLGLWLCRLLTELLGGEIHVDSTIGLGTAFMVRLPVIPKDDAIQDSEETIAVDWVSKSWLVDVEDYHDDLDAEKPIVVLAEDDPDMRIYISQILHDDYTVVAEPNGRAALEKIGSLIPDLVITDWMMPVMNGLELLAEMRNDRSLQHIPVVMLTAKAEVEDRIASFSTGAEAFLGKPFHPEELKAVLKSQLVQRERIRERFRTEMLRPDKYHSTSMEDQFMIELKKVMEKNLMNEQFGVETMADVLAMSRRTLVRKLHAVTGQAPVKYIRGYRLERALQMLKDNSAPVWEIAVKTGFGSASYFTKCFKDHYGISPKEAIHQN